MPKQKEAKDEEFHKSIIRHQKAEIKRLKQRVKQLERAEHNYNHPRTKEVDIDNDMLNQCNQCGKGFLKEIDLVGRIFEVCSLCDHRKKLNKAKRRK